MNVRERRDVEGRYLEKRKEGRETDHPGKN